MLDETLDNFEAYEYSRCYPCFRDEIYIAKVFVTWEWLVKKGKPVLMFFFCIFFQTEEGFCFDSDAAYAAVRALRRSDVMNTDVNEIFHLEVNFKSVFAKVLANHQFLLLLAVYSKNTLSFRLLDTRFTGTIELKTEKGELIDVLISFCGSEAPTKTRFLVVLGPFLIWNGRLRSLLFGWHAIFW